MQQDTGAELMEQNYEDTLDMCNEPKMSKEF